MDSLETKLSCLGGQTPLILAFQEETSTVLDRKLALKLFLCSYHQPPFGPFQSVKLNAKKKRKNIFVSLFLLPFSKDNIFDPCEESVLFIAYACIWKQLFHLHLTKLWFFQYLNSISEESFNSVGCGTLTSSFRVCFQ